MKRLDIYRRALGVLTGERRDECLRSGKLTRKQFAKIANELEAHGIVIKEAEERPNTDYRDPTE